MLTGSFFAAIYGNSEVIVYTYMNINQQHPNSTHDNHS